MISMPISDRGFRHVTSSLFRDVTGWRKIAASICFRRSSPLRFLQQPKNTFTKHFRLIEALNIKIAAEDYVHGALKKFKLQQNKSKISHKLEFVDSFYLP